MPRARIAALDGLRAGAALSVALYHVASLTGYTQHGAAGAILSQLKGGVAVFFAISGFVLYGPFARAIADAGSLPATSTYLRRRAARILPAYWAVLSAWLAISALTGGAAAAGGPGDLVREYGFGQIYSASSVSGGLGPAWSLCVEVVFYALLPVLAWTAAALVAARGDRSRTGAPLQLALIGSLFAVSLELRVGFTGSWLGRVSNAHTVMASTLPAMFDWFAAGMALAVLAAEWEARPERFPMLRRAGGHRWLPWLAAPALAVCAVPIQGGDLYLPLDSPACHLLLGLAAALLVLPLALPRERGPGHPLIARLASRRAVRLGTISYGIFLVNVPVFVELRALLFGAPADARLVVPEPPAATLLLAATTLLVSAWLASLCWRWVEVPAQRRWRDARPRRAGAHAAAGSPMKTLEGAAAIAGAGLSAEPPSTETQTSGITQTR